MKFMFNSNSQFSFQSKQFGSRGEDIAEKFLLAKGYQVIQRNYTIRGGEIDLIAIKNQTLTFFEIKTRQNFKFGLPSEVISLKQKDTLIKTAQHFLASNVFAYVYKNVQFDLLVIKLTIQNSRRLVKIGHYQNIFLE